jgi:hypothetical protein
VAKWLGGWVACVNAGLFFLFSPSSCAVVFVVCAANWVAKRKARRRLRYNTATTT